MHHQHHHQLKQRTTKRFSVFAHLLHFTAISIWAYLYLPVTLNDCPSLSPSPFMILYTYILYYIQYSRHIPPVSISVGDGVWASFYYYHYDYYYYCYKYPFPRLSLSVHHSSSAMSLIRYSSMHACCIASHTLVPVYPSIQWRCSNKTVTLFLSPTHSCNNIYKSHRSRRCRSRCAAPFIQFFIHNKKYIQHTLGSAQCARVGVLRPVFFCLFVVRV